MINTELLGALAWLVLGALTTWSGVTHGIGQVSDPGSGFVLFWTGIVICALAALVLASAVSNGGPALRSLWAGTRWGKVLAVIALLGGYAIFFDDLGFLVATIPLMLALMRVVEPAPWAVAIPLALAVPLGTWWILKHVVRIQLPAGLLGIG